MNNIKIAACLFDLDGVIVDTAKYHFLAWKQLADELNIDFTEEHNELLKGVSRMESLEIILRIGRKDIPKEQKLELAEEKNRNYLSYIKKMTESELLPGTRTFLQQLREMGIGIALGSASKNAMLILERLNIISLFDAIVDGTMVTNAKPDPEIYLKGADALKISPQACIVFEDALAGIEAAHRAGMVCIGVGDPKTLQNADRVIPGFDGLRPQDVFQSILINS